DLQGDVHRGTLLYLELDCLCQRGLKSFFLNGHRVAANATRRSHIVARATSGGYARGAFIHSANRDLRSRNHSRSGVPHRTDDTAGVFLGPQARGKAKAQHEKRDSGGTLAQKKRSQVEIARMVNDAVHDSPPGGVQKPKAPLPAHPGKITRLPRSPGGGQVALRPNGIRPWRRIFLSALGVYIV